MSQGDAPATTPADLRRITDTFEDAINGNYGNYQPKGNGLAPFRAAVSLSEAARKAAAPYAIPSEFQGNLPERPDTAEVRTLQAELKSACSIR